MESPSGKGKQEALGCALGLLEAPAQAGILLGGLKDTFSRYHLFAAGRHLMGNGPSTTAHPSISHNFSVGSRGNSCSAHIVRQTRLTDSSLRLGGKEPPNPTPTGRGAGLSGVPLSTIDLAATRQPVEAIAATLQGTPTPVPPRRFKTAYIFFSAFRYKQLKEERLLQGGETQVSLDRMNRVETYQYGQCSGSLTP